MPPEIDRMNQSSRSYIRADEERLLTINWHCVSQKPSAAAGLP